MVNRLCECLECDTIYMAADALGKVRESNLYTFCSSECESSNDELAKELEEKFESLAKAPERAVETPAVNSTKTLDEVMKGFIDAQREITRTGSE